MLVLALAACDGGSGSSGETDGGSSGSTSGSNTSGPSTSASTSADDTTSPTSAGSTSADTTSGPDTADDSTGGDDSGSESSSTGEVQQGEPVWMVVGNWGYRSWTRDGNTWDSESNPEQGTDHTPDLLRGVAWGNGHFIAVGGDLNSMVMRSVDGTNWEVDLHPAGTQWKGDVAYGGGRWVAVGGVGTVISSDDDGATWVDHEERLPSAGRSISYADGVFVAVGDNGMIAVSEDGMAWTDRTQAGIQAGSAAFAQGTWVVAGRRWNGSGFDASCVLSTDTETWTACPFGGEYVRALSAEGRLYVVRDSGYAVSDDGETWQESDTSVPDAFAGADGLWVGARGDRRYAGDSVDGLAEVLSGERGIRDFTMGYAE